MARPKMLANSTAGHGNVKEDPLSQGRRLVGALVRSLDNQTGNVPGAKTVLIETHISWVLLNGEFAYKIKKPVNLGFLNFSTLAQREHFCNEELILNRRFAPNLYLEISRITGNAEAPVLGGVGPAIEYAVKMRRFDPNAGLDALLARQVLTSDIIDQLAHTLAIHHRDADHAPPNSSFGMPSSVIGRVGESIQLIRSLAPRFKNTNTLINELDALDYWLHEPNRRIETLAKVRKGQGFVRECHGDLHLANIALINGEVTPFDCLEFDPDLRWIDVMSDVAFVMMDLLVKQQPALAYRFLNVYLESSGDYDGLRMLRFYLIYRALVRAKVALLKAQQLASEVPERDQQILSAQRHVTLALAQTRVATPGLVACFGLSGSGKTVFSQSLCGYLSAIRIRSDIERKRLAGLPALAVSASPLGQGLYSSSLSERTYDRLAYLSEAAIDAGFSVLVDATFLKAAQRARFAALAKQKSAAFTILEIVADESVLRLRIARRLKSKCDASEADLAVLTDQISQLEPLNPAEQGARLRIDNSLDRDAAALSALCLATASRILDPIQIKHTSA